MNPPPYHPGGLDTPYLPGAGTHLTIQMQDYMYQFQIYHREDISTRIVINHKIRKEYIQVVIREKYL